MPVLRPTLRSLLQIQFVSSHCNSSMFRLTASGEVQEIPSVFGSRFGRGGFLVLALVLAQVFALVLTPSHY